MRIELFFDNFDGVLQLSETGNATQQRNENPGGACLSLAKNSEGLWVALRSTHPTGLNS
jgi:hypothetical protein